MHAGYMRQGARQGLQPASVLDGVLISLVLLLVDGGRMFGSGPFLLSLEILLHYYFVLINLMPILISDSAQ